MIQKQVQRVICKTKEIFEYRRGLRTMAHRAAQPRDPGVARVVFIAQYLPAWTKVQKLYEALRASGQAQVYILCVPTDIAASGSNDTYAYFTAHGYDAIDARQSDGSWFNLRQIKPDVVFHSRPYNEYMPAPYSSGEVAKYAQVCQILYGVCMTHGGTRCVMNFDFFKDVTRFYAENADVESYFNKRFAAGVRRGLQSARDFGSPVLEYVIQAQHEAQDYYPALQNTFRMIWTPRWSTDPKIGGSNFFRYRELLMGYAEKHPDVSLLLRPHPLMLNHFIETGELTAAQAQEFRDQCASAPNMALDERKDYTDQFWCSDALISDASAVVFEYFVTGKPVIYCNSQIDFEYLPQVREMFEGCYMADNADDVEKYIDMLRRGEDPLSDTRRMLIRKLYGRSISGCSERICQDVLHLVGQK